VQYIHYRDLRNHGGDVADRAACGERITITCAGKAVAELRAVPRPSLSTEALLARLRLLPAVDADALRADIDQTLDAIL
jgi:antitoxin (DNA-binding transcriptional repressor) of toxin-antitoxin stability system